MRHEPASGGPPRPGRDLSVGRSVRGASVQKPLSRQRTMHWRIVPAHPLSSAQFDKLADTVVNLATTHEFGDWRIQDVVAATGISSRTIYKYFPTKEYLLLSAVVTQYGSPEDLLPVRAARGRTPRTRALRVLDSMTEAQLAFPKLSRSMVRALTCGQQEVAPLLHEYTALVRAALARALAGPQPESRDMAAAQVLQQVWFSALVAWASNIEPANHIETSVRQALSLIAA